MIKQRSPLTLPLLAAACLAFGGFVGNRLTVEVARDKLDASSTALGEALAARELAQNAVGAMETDFSKCRVALADEKQMMKDVEATVDRCHERHKSDCEGVPLPERLWELHDKCVEAWNACDWEKGRKVTERGTENACENRVRECRALLAAAQPGVRSF